MSNFVSGPEAQREFRKMSAGLGLPRNPSRALSKMQSMQRNIADGSAMRTAMNTASVGVGQRRGSLQMALEKPRGPLDRFSQSSLPHDVGDPAQREKIRDLCRTYYKIHNLVPLLIDIYCRFPIQGMSIEHNDSELQEFYEELFFNDLDYESFLIDFGREFFTVGEVNSIASFSEILGVWEREQIINPDDLTVSQAPMSKDQRFHLRVPAELALIVETKEPRADYEFLRREYPEIIDAANKDRSGYVNDSVLGPGLEVSNVLLSRLVNKTAAWDLYGTPHMLRVFQNLNLEEGLLAAQKAIADRLYSPLILAKLGSPDLGDGVPWVPDPDQLDAFSDLMNQAMSADFRFLTYHYGIEIESVFGRENVPNLDGDFDRIERKILQAWGIGESLISGSSNGSYASSALNSELVNQLMSSYQKFLKKHFKKRCEVIAEAQGHFEYDTRGGERYTVYEEYVEIQEDGEEIVKERPKLAVPELKFKSITLRDEETERQFLMQLKTAGIPISDRTILETVDLDFDEEVEKLSEEKAEKVMANQEVMTKVINILKIKGLPLTPELLTLIAQQTAPAPPATISPGMGGDITTPPNVPNLVMDPAAQGAAMNDAAIVPVMPGGMQEAPAPGAPPAPGEPSGPTMLPQNQISQRPEISNDQAAGMPRRSKSSMRHDPTVVGQRNKLSKESIDYLTNKRPWTRSLRRRQQGK